MGPGIMYGLCKVHKDIIDNCLPFRPILSAINTPIYKLAKFLVPISKFLTSNEYEIKNSFDFAEEIVEQDSEFSKERTSTSCHQRMLFYFWRKAVQASRWSHHGFTFRSDAG